LIINFPTLRIFNVEKNICTIEKINFVVEFV
jgi:hypothetical protein